MTRMPTTKPNWTNGRFAVLVDDEMQGYFRQFRSAWNWKVYLQATRTGGRVLICENGRIVNIGTCGTHDTVTL
jgi:hypothetical protein